MVKSRIRKPAISDDAGLLIEQDKEYIRVAGALDLPHFQQAKKELKQALSRAGRKASIDLSGLTRFDTSGALLLQQLAGKQVEIVHLSAGHQALFELVSRAKTTPIKLVKPTSSWVQTITHLGRSLVETLRGTRELISFLGQSAVAITQAFRHPRRWRLHSITHHIERTAIDAIPIISLVAFVISVVIAYQGQVQLRMLGAEKYTVNLIAISVMREMGALLTAIMIAGRSGSAFTAEIGTMRVREEVDALKSLGFDTFELLVLPRLIALIIALPLLTLLADMMGLFGGAIISMALIDISPAEYIERARHALVPSDFYVGMIKAPVFACVIALVGCMHGLKVSGSAESVGKETTASVVQSIFLILVLDGLFSIYFGKVGL